MRFSSIAIAIALSLPLLGCAAPPPVVPGTQYSIPGVSMVSPNEPGWWVKRPENGKILFGKRGAQAGDNSWLKVEITMIDAALSDEQVHDWAKHMLTTYSTGDPAVFFPLILRVEPLTFKGADCISNDRILQYKPGKGDRPGQRYENAFGYICRHPLHKDIAVDIVYGGERSSAPAVPRNNRAIAEAFFDSVVFTDAGPH